MDLKGILSISGQSGLFKLIKHSKGGIIVESLENKRRMPAYATSKISALEDIAIYTTESDVHLTEVFKNIYRLEQEGDRIDNKSDNKTLVEHFAKVLPNYDRDRVYISDIKRVYNWYNTLQKLEMLNFTESEAQTVDSETVENAQPDSNSL